MQREIKAKLEEIVERKALKNKLIPIFLKDLTGTELFTRPLHQ